VHTAQAFCSTDKQAWQEMYCWSTGGCRPTGPVLSATGVAEL